jgi:tight adherence protein C
VSDKYILYILIAVGVFTAYMAIVHIFRRDRMRERLQTAHGMAFGEEQRPSALAMFCKGILAMTGVDMKSHKPLTLLLQQAGIHSPNAPIYFVFFRRFVQPIVFVLGMIVFLKVIVSTNMRSLDLMLYMITALLLLVIGMFGANLFVTNTKQRRQQKLLYSFPEMLDLMLVCIESGLGLDAAIARVCAEMRETHPEIAYELEKTRTELTMLPDRVQALQNLSDRTEIVAFKSLVSSLIQTERFGTSLLDTLRVLSDDQRVTRLLNAENKAARIPVLITIPLILCILPSFIIIILGPPIVKVDQQGGLFGAQHTIK